MGGGGKGWDVHLKVEPAKEEKKEEEHAGGGDGGSGWVIALVVLGLLLLWYLYAGSGGRSFGGNGCTGAQHPGYSCAGGGHDWGLRGYGHDRP